MYTFISSDASNFWKSPFLYNYKLAAVASTRCMGHNRGWEEAASFFSGLPVELKTANAALLETSSSSWEEVFHFGLFQLRAYLDMCLF